MEEGRKGYVPVLVGKGGNTMQKIWVPIKVIQHPTIVELLNQSADEFGYQHQQGVLRITYDANSFKALIQELSKNFLVSNRKTILCGGHISRTLRLSQSKKTITESLVFVKKKREKSEICNTVATKCNTGGDPNGLCDMWKHHAKTRSIATLKVEEREKEEGKIWEMNNLNCLF
ncbi:hypothetical protein VNO80_06205 [Phaseolus coccineus]|uniref:Uncharacterized protein n=1 Tax=Phaseolus coccineus TaxID=3886 RepID=A0AAN9NL75_PHACN